MLNPYSCTDGLATFKGDLHFHSTASDGSAAAASMFDRLIECGFDFCALADHDLPVRASFRHGQLLNLPNQELSAETGHILSLFSDVSRQDYWSTAEQLRAISRTDGFAILSHPKIREFTGAQGPTYSADRLVNELAGLYGGVELYTHNVGSGLKLAIDRLDVVWTSMVSPWRPAPEASPRSVWGFASSDAHCVEKITENVGIIVWAEELSEQSLRDAISRGAFYSLADSTARFPEIAVDETSMGAGAANAVSMRIVKAAGLPVKVAARKTPGSLRISYRIRGDEGYLRIEAMDAAGNCAYTNPVFLADIS